MAITVTKVNAAITDRAPQAFVDAVSRNSTAWNLLRKTPVSDAKGPRWQVKYSGSTASAFALGGAFPSATQYEHIQASLDWGRCVQTINIYGQALDELAAGAGDLAISNYLETQIDEAVTAMVATLDGWILGGTTTNGYVGLQVGIDSTGTYAGLARATYTNFASYQNDNTGTPRAVTKALLDTTYLQFVNVRKGMPTHLLTTPTIRDSICTLTSGAGIPAIRQNITAQERTSFFQMGFGSPQTDLFGFYKGIPCVAIQGLAAGTVYFANLNSIHIEVLRDFRVSEMRRINDDFFFDLTCISQLVVPNPRKDGAVLEDLS